MPSNSNKKRRASTASSSEPEVSKKARTSKAASEPEQSTKSAAVSGGGTRTAEGDVWWEIGTKRRIVVGEFKGKTMVSVREFYEKDGAELPGKKGITMTTVQFAALVEALPHVEKALGEKGVRLPRPSYDGEAADAMDTTAEEEEAAEAETERKRNIDATSDEDE